MQEKKTISLVSFAYSEKVKELLKSETISEIIVAQKTNSFIRKLIYQVS